MSHSHEHDHHPMRLYDIIADLVQLTQSRVLEWRRIDAVTWRANRAGVRLILDARGLVALDTKDQTLGYLDYQCIQGTALPEAVERATQSSQVYATQLLTRLAMGPQELEQAERAERERRDLIIRAAGHRREVQRQGAMDQA